MRRRRMAAVGLVVLCLVAGIGSAFPVVWIFGREAAVGLTFEFSFLLVLFGMYRAIPMWTGRKWMWQE